MKVMLYFSSQFVGSADIEVEVSDDSTTEYIESLFPEYIGTKFDDNCWFEILE